MAHLVAVLGHRWFGASRDAAFVFAATLATFLVSDGYPGWEAPVLTVINTALVVAWGLAADLYDTSHPRVASPPLAPIVRMVVGVLLTYLAVHFVTAGDPERRTIVFATGAVVGSMVLGYSIRVVALLWFQGRGLLRERLLIVGGDEQALAVAEQIDRERRVSLQLVGALDEFAPRSSRLGPVEVLGDPLELSAVVDRTRATAVVVVANAISWEAQEHVMRVAADQPELRVFMVAGVSDLLSSEVVTARDGLPSLVRLRPAQLRRSDALIKRAVDLSLGLLLLPVVIMVLVVALVAGGRPLTRRVEVLGRGGAPVRMRLLEPGRPGSLRARLAGGRAGKLPALAAVLLGRLSLVGPRPIPADAPDVGGASRRRLLLMAPGLTGPWDREGTPSDSVLDDLAYIRTYTPWSDVRLLLGSFARFMTRQTPVPALRDMEPSAGSRRAGAVPGPRDGS
jgi:lipopolysaccharide/colanic/teichoic acid biosynthesis glycosyltransferase